ncbi:hypothetical protein D3C86_1659770 [compost metagenome]
MSIKTRLVTNVSDSAVGVPGGETMYPLGITLQPGEQVEIDLSAETLKLLKGFDHVEISDVGRHESGGNTGAAE